MGGTQVRDSGRRGSTVLPLLLELELPEAGLSVQEGEGPHAARGHGFLQGQAC